MDKKFESCEWCNGTGTERRHPMDTGYPCPDCEGSGMVGGQAALRDFDDYIEEQHQQYLANK
jgi:DnaJ-class molecular chaperone